jgi:hypothetical protein
MVSSEFSHLPTRNWLGLTKSVILIPVLMKLTQERMQQSNDPNIKNTSVPSVTLVVLSFSLNTLVKKLLSIFVPESCSVGGL